MKKVNRWLVLSALMMLASNDDGYCFGRLFKGEETNYQNQTAPDLVSDHYDIKKNRYYERLLERETIVGNAENIKIMYLIEELRQSPYRFERNGEIYTSQRAAQHLMMKYNRTKDRVKTAQDFIELLASKSSRTGKDYYVIFDNQLKFPAKYVLNRELQKLDEILRAQPPISAV